MNLESIANTEEKEQCLKKKNCIVQSKNMNINRNNTRDDTALKQNSDNKHKQWGKERDRQ